MTFSVEAMADEIHASNVVAGWWSDKDSGESILATRNRGEIMMLIVSELGEAHEGADEGLRDDKLPHHAMFDVELADTAIRLFDLLGAERQYIGGATIGMLPDLDADIMQPFAFRSIDAKLMVVIRTVIAAMEAHRKGRTHTYLIALHDALSMVFALAAMHGIPLLEIIAEKRSFNAVREDHRLENRRAAGGKAY